MNETAASSSSPSGSPGDPAPSVLERWIARHEATQGDLAAVLSHETTEHWSQSKVSSVVTGRRPLTWRERIEIAVALGFDPAELGAGSSPGGAPPSRNRRGYASNLAEAAEELRSAGRSTAAVAIVADELAPLQWQTAEPESQADREILIELLLALATARSDVMPAHHLEAVTVPMLKRARQLVAGLEERGPELGWKVAMRLGNELRKTGNLRAGTFYLEQALRLAPNRDYRNQTLVVYARALTSGRRTDDLKPIVREVQEQALDPSNFSVSLHPLSAIDTEFRSALIERRPRHQWTSALREQLDDRTHLPPGRPPQWDLTWGISSLADAVNAGDRERALGARDVILRVARELDLPADMKRLRNVDAVFDHARNFGSVRERWQLACGLVT